MPPDRTPALPARRRPPADGSPPRPEETRANIRAIFHRKALERMRRRLPPPPADK